MQHPSAERWRQLMQHLPPTARLLAVSKGHSAEAVREVASLGQLAFGESRLQEAVPKQLQLEDLPLQWHYIGRLQSNKVRGVVRAFSIIHSIDSLALAERVSRIAAEEGCSPDVLLQVKLRPDPAKGGFTEELLLEVWPQLVSLPSMQIQGLMTMAPQALEATERLCLFQECSALAERLGLPERSMGMSGDWREAVEAGSTWLRLGSALFGPRSAVTDG
ncbi:MAG: YggS family pyridoxal phosphate-dependent enzyme [Cyanobium sp. NAT70]|nr:YggS family pyridoxal phosphate-dependent enzyme [Cyanobium sp. NAT70]